MRNKIQYYREMWIHEDNIINYRLSWLLYGQTVLFAAYSVVLGISAEFPCYGKATTLINWLPWLGIAVAIITFAGLIASLRAHRHINKKCYGKMVSLKSPWHWLGLCPPILLPIIFFVAWIIILFS